jgi:hypothetical protein
MSASPHKIENLALARDTLTNLTLLAACTPEHRAELVRLAQAILQTDRACRLGLDLDAPQGPGRVIRIPLAVFQAGRIRNCARRSAAAHPTTPGDAA